MVLELKTAASKSGAKLKLKITPAYRAFHLKAGQPVVRRALEAAKQIGIKAELKATGGGSDANIFNALGIPTIILGVGAQNVHTTRESIKIANLEKGLRYLLAVIT